MTPTTPGKEPPRGWRPRAKPSEEIVLGTIPEGPYDTELNSGLAPGVPAPQQAAPAVPPARRRPTRPARKAPQPETPVAGGPPETTDEDLTLPPGAWLALRRSGGLLFSSREVVVYPDGRVDSATVGGGRPAGVGQPRMLTAPQLAALRRAVAGIDFGRLLPSSRRQPPDTYAYELVVREGRTTHAVEVFDGAIPEALAPLIRQLGRLLAAGG